MTVSLSNLSDLARKRVAVAAYYFVPGVVFASWASRIPDVKQMLHLSNGQLGTVLFAIPIGQLLMMAFSGILVSRFGSKKMLVLSELLYVLVLFCIGSSTTVFHLILSLIAFGMMANLMNIVSWSVESGWILRWYHRCHLCQHFAPDRCPFWNYPGSEYSHRCCRFPLSD